MILQGKFATDQAKFPGNICVEERELEFGFLKFEFFKLYIRTV